MKSHLRPLFTVLLLIVDRSTPLGSSYNSRSIGASRHCVFHPNYPDEQLGNPNPKALSANGRCE